MPRIMPLYSRLYRIVTKQSSCNYQVNMKLSKIDRKN